MHIELTDYLEEKDNLFVPGDLFKVGDDAFVLVRHYKDLYNNLYSLNKWYYLNAIYTDSITMKEIKDILGKQAQGVSVIPTGVSTCLAGGTKLTSKHSDEEYVLADIGDNVFTLINTTTGKTPFCKIRCAPGETGITKDEFMRILGDVNPLDFRITEIKRGCHN